MSGSPTTSSLALGPGLTWNVFDYDRVENNIRVQDARYQQLAERYRDTILQAARDVDSSAIALLKNQEQLVINEEVTVAAQRALDIASLQYREGFSDFSRVLDAQRSYFSQTERVVGNRSNMVLSLIALYKALGGGWEPGRFGPWSMTPPASRCRLSPTGVACWIEPCPCQTPVHQPPEWNSQSRHESERKFQQAG